MSDRYFLTDWVLERVKLGISQLVSAELARTLRGSEYADFLTENIAYEFHGYLYGHHEPATWVDALKERINGRLGTEFTVRRVTNVCPHLSSSPSLHVTFAGKRK